jgi:Vitamin K-dependent gamma-carboxylase
MTVASLFRKWNAFFFEPAPPTPVALYRILYGIMNLANLLLLAPDWTAWYGPHAVASLATVHRLHPSMRFNIFFLLPPTDHVMNVFFWVFLVLCICVTVGLMTRVSMILLYIGLTSLQITNPYILNSGDTLLRVSGFFLMFAPAGAAFSVDRLFRIWRGKEGVEVPLYMPWAQRLIQIQTSIVYITTFWWKSFGPKWVNGTSVYYALRMREFLRFPIPDFLVFNRLFIRVATWGTLVTEFSAGVLIWLRDLRYYVIIAAICLHAGIEYSMNIPMFEWITVSTLVTFVYPEDLARFWARIRARVTPWLGGVRIVLYDPLLTPSARTADVLRAVDIFGRLQLVDARSPAARPPGAGRSPSVGKGRFLVQTPGGLRSGLAAWIAIAPVVPVLWLLAPLSVFSRAARQPSGAASTAG